MGRGWEVKQGGRIKEIELKQDLGKYIIGKDPYILTMDHVLGTAAVDRPRAKWQGGVQS